MNIMISEKHRKRISVTLPSFLVDEVKRTSGNDSTTQSSVIESALMFWFRSKLSRDAKALSQIHFNDLPTEDGWLLIEEND